MVLHYYENYKKNKKNNIIEEENSDSNIIQTNMNKSQRFSNGISLEDIQITTNKNKSFQTTKKELSGFFLKNIVNNTNKNTPIALIGCKSDLYLHNMFIEEGKEFARNHNLYFYQLSAKENIGVDECFNDFIDRIIPKEENEKKIELNNLRRKRQPKRGCLK